MKMAKGRNGLNQWGCKNAKANAHIAQTYSLIWTSACVWHNHVDGGGVGFGALSKDLWEANAYALIVCSSCNVF